MTSFSHFQTGHLTVIFSFLILHGIFVKYMLCKHLAYSGLYIFGTESLEKYRCYFSEVKFSFVVCTFNQFTLYWFLWAMFVTASIVCILYIYMYIYLHIYTDNLSNMTRISQLMLLWIVSSFFLWDRTSEPSLAPNLLYGRWACTVDSPTSTSYASGLTDPAFIWFLNFVHARPALCQLSHIPRMCLALSSFCSHYLDMLGLFCMSCLPCHLWTFSFLYHL